MNSQTKPDKDPYLPPLTADVRKYTKEVLECAARYAGVPGGWESALVAAQRVLVRDATKHVAALFPEDWWVVREAPGQTHKWNVFVAGEDGKMDYKRFVATFREEAGARRLVAEHNRPLGEMSSLLGEVEKILASKAPDGPAIDWRRVLVGPCE